MPMKTWTSLRPSDIVLSSYFGRKSRIGCKQFLNDETASQPGFFSFSKISRRHFCNVGNSKITILMLRFVAFNGKSLLQALNDRERRNRNCTKGEVFILIVAFPLINFISFQYHFRYNSLCNLFDIHRYLFAHFFPFDSSVLHAPPLLFSIFIPFLFSIYSIFSNCWTRYLG